MTFTDLSPGQAAARLGELRIIDVREPAEFDGPLGHIATAELVPLATLPEAAGAWRRDQPLLLVCRSGNRSGRAATELATMGFSSLFNLAGGMLAWNEQTR